MRTLDATAIGVLNATAGEIGYRPTARKYGIPPADLHDLAKGKHVGPKRRRRMAEALKDNTEFVAAWLDAALIELERKKK